MKKIKTTSLSVEKFLLIGLFFCTSIIMIAIGSEASKNIAVFSVDETYLKIVLATAFIGQIITVICITFSDEMRHFTKWIRLSIVVFFILYLILSLINFKVGLYDSFLVGLIFLPGFICTFLNFYFPQKQTAEKRKKLLAINGYDVNNPISVFENGDMKLKKQITPQHYSYIEVDRYYRRIMNDQCSMNHKH